MDNAEFNEMTELAEQVTKHVCADLEITGNGSAFVFDEVLSALEYLVAHDLLDMDKFS